MTIGAGLFIYEFHGLRVASQLALTELTPAADGSVPASAIDVTVELGATPTEIAGAVRFAEDYQVGVDGILLNIPTVGRYFARGGRSITIEPARGADAGALQLYLIGSGIAAILHQRGLFPLHACAFEHEGTCIAFLGDSGAGKSTLAALLSERGYSLVTDDVLVTRSTEDGRILAEPSLPILKLWPQSLDAAGLASAPAPYECIDHNKHRIVAPERFSGEPLPVTRLYFLRWLLPATAGPEVAPLKNFDAMMMLRANVYRPALIEAMGREQAFMDMAGRLIARAGAFEFRRAMDLSRAEAQIDALVRHLEQA
jgi:hypothetical protein